MRRQDESWPPKSLIPRQPGSLLGHVPTPRGGPRSGKGPSGVRNFSEVAADASPDMVGGGLARTPTPPRSNLSAALCCRGAPDGSRGCSRPPSQRLSGLSESLFLPMSFNWRTESICIERNRFLGNKALFVFTSTRNPHQRCRLLPLRLSSY